MKHLYYILTLFLLTSPLLAERDKYFIDGIISDGEYKRLEYLREHSDFDATTKRELRIIRNTIYAKHGYCFESAELQEHFQRFKWYECLNNNKSIESRLSTNEKINVVLIKSIEKGLASEEALYNYKYHNLDLNSGGYGEWKKGDMEKTIVGLWANVFPVGAGHYHLYTFLADHQFVFLNIDEGEAIYGSWKLDDFTLLIKLQNTDEWVEACDVRSYRFHWHPSMEGAPPQLAILFLKEGKAMPYVHEFYKFQ